jgi:hypothetical protein
LAGYCALGEAVLGASVNPPITGKGKQPERHVIRKSGTSTATCVATGLAVMLINYTRRCVDPDIVKFDSAKMDQCFIKMSEASSSQMYHYISPWCFFGPNQETKNIIEGIMKKTLPAVSKYKNENVLISSCAEPTSTAAIAIRHKH